MHRFHYSRGRILFEVFCALAIAASCAGAWMQTGASALLPAAGVAALYGLVHLFDMRRRPSAEAAEPKPIDVEEGSQSHRPALMSRAADDQKLTTDNAIEEAEIVEQPAPRASASRRAKTPRKGSGRRANTPKEVKVTELAPPEEVEVPVPPEEVAHVPLAPLFEPEPFARQQRAVFGRRAG